jgi:AAA domain
MKTIATINFKGGVGKITCTWALGYVAAQSPKVSSLVFDLDAQMSLTESIALNEEGNPFRNFTDWYDRAIAKKKTIFDALDEFTKTDSQFQFGINSDFIYRINDNYHFVPSVQDLYWTELEVWDREKVFCFDRARSEGANPLGEVVEGIELTLTRYEYLSRVAVVRAPIRGTLDGVLRCSEGFQSVGDPHRDGG